ncbi:HAD family hydrolase [Alkalimarinus coralli]|uniref:HAD family hydrolase n=1 Tax=Alkalimarinus coralli TaxID=2935863 RepID=UPI00202AD530|nr:HAD family hydrolase [Alkalimarinus coralli]
MSLALFDLDNTLISGDSSQSFSEYLANSELRTPEDFLTVNEAYMADYDSGNLDLSAYMRYTLSPLINLGKMQVRELINDFLDQILPSLLLPKAFDLLESHRAKGEELVIVSATGTHLVEPIAERLNVDHVLAVNVEVKDGFITGEIEGTPTFREGKVERAQEWAAKRGHNIEQASFYSDSLNDLPLLKAVNRPVAVDPDPVLERIAREQTWEIISLR